MAVRLQNGRDGLTGETWDRKQFYRLCRMLHCQPVELAERYFIPTSALSAWLKKDAIPPYAALHFILLERTYFQCSRSAKMKPEENVITSHD